MTAIVASAGTGFLLAVLWFDLPFDVQVWRHRRARTVPEPVLASIAGSYARVTTAARPMNLAVALAMVATLVALLARVLDGTHVGIRIAALLLALLAIVRAASRTVRNAVRLGTRADDAETQTDLARRIHADHIACIVLVSSSLVLQVSDRLG